jgi:hypothetical protein
MSEHKKLQEVMNKAYEKFGNLTYEEFISSLDEKEMNIVLIGNLNYQVSNGGFSQWIGNNYSKMSDDLIYALRAVNTDTCKKVIGLVKKALEVYEEYGEDEDDAFYELDDAFYEINKTMLEDVERFHFKE